MIVSDLIRMSLRKINALSMGEGLLAVQEIPGSQYSDMLITLQVMLRSWSQSKINVYSSKRESVSLIPSQSLYTWGVGGNINSERPHKILSAFVRDVNGSDVPVEIISENQYNSIAVKSSTGRPCYLFFQPEYPLVNVYLYPTPDISETLWISSLKPFTEASSFSSVSDNIAFPTNYEEAIIYNLAIRLAPDFGISVPGEVALIASKSYEDIIHLNAANSVEPISAILPAGGGYGGRRYNINLG